MSGQQTLREIVAAEEAEAAEIENEAVEPIEVETESEDTEQPAEAETVTEDEEVDEIELTLDDEPQVTNKYTPEQALVHKLTKEKKKRQEATSELEQLRAENEALKAGRQPQAVTQPIVSAVTSPQAEPPKPPVLYENGITTPAEYQVAFEQWWKDRAAYDQHQHYQTQQTVKAQQDTQARAQRLAERSAEFIQSNKIKAELATNTIQAGVQGLDEVLGVDGAALDLLDNIGDGSDKLAYYLGKNPEALATAKKLFDDDPRGFKVNTWLTKTAGKLNRKNSTISKAPAPDEALNGDVSVESGHAKSLQKQYDKETDFKKLREISRKAREAGIKLEIR